MGDEEARDRQLSLLGAVLKRTDLERGEIVIFTDMKVAILKHGAVLSEAQEGWVCRVNSRPMPDLAKVEAVDVPAPWRPMTVTQVVVFCGAVVVGLVVFQNLLTFLLHWLGWR